MNQIHLSYKTGWKVEFISKFTNQLIFIQYTSLTQDSSLLGQIMLNEVFESGVLKISRFSFLSNDVSLNLLLCSPSQRSALNFMSANSIFDVYSFNFLHLNLWCTQDFRDKSILRPNTKLIRCRTFVFHRCFTYHSNLYFTPPENSLFPIFLLLHNSWKADIVKTVVRETTQQSFITRIGTAGNETRITVPHVLEYHFDTLR